MPSPVWLDDNDPDVENFDDLLDDFMLDEYDDYFDQQPLTKRKRERHDGDDPTTPSKRRKLSQAEEDLENPASASIVVWRTRAHSPVPCPVIDVGSGKGVAILKDWRERSKIRPHDISNGPESRPRSSEQTFAVVVERRQPDKGLPAVESQEALQPKKGNPTPAVNGTSTTASSRAKNKGNREPTSKSVPAALTHKNKLSIPAAPKRKRLELDDEEDELQADPSDFAQPKKRPMREPSRQTQPSTRGTASKARGRKPKSSETDPPTSTVSTNGKTSKSKVSASSSARGGRNAKVGPTARPSTCKRE